MMMTTQTTTATMMTQPTLRQAQGRLMTTPAAAGVENPDRPNPTNRGRSNLPKQAIRQRRPESPVCIWKTICSLNHPHFRNPRKRNRSFALRFMGIETNRVLGASCGLPGWGPGSKISLERHFGE